MFKSLQEIQTKFNYKFTTDELKYEQEIIDIFNGIDFKNNNDIIFNMVGLYHYNITKDYDLMLKYFSMAVDLGNTKAMYNLGMFYQNVMNDHVKAEEYFSMAGIFNCGITLYIDS